ncbi:MAG TPA: response regulator [Desulfuromonadales bacterium]|nr:response regulator [Desulfuromonadales bacterium]
MKILIIEDEKRLARLLKQGLEEQGFVVDLACNGTEGQYQAEQYPYDTLLLDLMLPEVDGLTILKGLREKGNAVPVLIVTARGDVEDRIRGLNLGADDYLAKPFDLEELIARLRALIRRSRGQSSPLITVGDLTIDSNSRTVTRAEKRLSLSAREYDLLHYLALNSGRVISRTELIEHIYASDYEWDSNSMLVRLHHVFESQKRLVADASHELKTPLAVITTQCDVTLLSERRSEEYVETIKSIRSETKNITHLVNDLLSLARLDAGLISASRYEPVYIRDLVAYAVRLTAPLAAEREICVTTDSDDDLQMSCVRTALEEALLNLVENGIRYNHAGGKVIISTTINECRELVIEVRDGGNGIGSADLERIFERFYRAATSRSSNGSGLGLSIVKAIIEGHDGRITVVSNAGEGSCFTIVLPKSIVTSRLTHLSETPAGQMHAP